jgi:hypothetical protein
MLFYWRVQSDLNEIGNLLIFKHPNLSREFEKWVRKNAGGLALAEDLSRNTIERLSLSPN